MRTNHRNLEHWQTAGHLNQRQIRWAQFFTRFNFRVQYVSGPQNQRADPLSWKPEYQGEEAAPVQRHILKLEQIQLAAVSVAKTPDFLKHPAKDEFARRNMEAIQRRDTAVEGFAERGGLLYK